MKQVKTIEHSDPVDLPVITGLDSNPRAQDEQYRPDGENTSLGVMIEVPSAAWDSRN